jgi:DNA (cytosine-5)-methyltransferase 1
VTTIGSLFSGIGGLELGLEMLGLGPVVWQAESDPFARAVLTKHWPTVHRYEDVREIDATAPRPDIICGGFPCQDISVAGKGAGIEGDRSSLWFEFARIVRELRPAFIFVENVPPLVKRGLDRVLWDLAEGGFDAVWDCFSAADVGASQKRERFFLVAYAAQLGRNERGGEPGDGEPSTRAERGGLEKSRRRSDQAARHLADTARDGRGEGKPESAWRAGRSSVGAGGDQVDVADADSGRREGIGIAQSARVEGAPGSQPDGRGDLRYVHRFPPGPAAIEGWPGAQPAIRRGDAGIPAGMDRGWRSKNRVTDRLRLLGNACVPQQAALAWETLTARIARSSRPEGAAKP